MAVNFTLASVAPASAEIFMLVMTSGILLFDVFAGKNARRVTYGLALIALLGAAVLTLGNATGPTRFAFDGLFVDDAMSRLLKVALYVTVAATLVYSRGYLEARGLFSGEFITLVLFATLGMMVMISAHSFITLYIGLELLSLSLYASVALQRDSAQATEAAMKYFILGALASGLLLYGVSMIYGATGSLDLTQVGQMIRGGRANSTLTVFGLVFIVAGLGFKLGAVPFHMWIPDVYHGAATPVTLLIGGAPKIAALAFVLRILAEGLQGVVGEWRDMLAILAALSIGVGNVVAIAQTNIKRMLAYSTISHMGFLLLGILAGGENGYASAAFYVILYALMTLLSFGVILLLTRDGFEADQLEDFKGLNQRSRWHAFLMLVVMFSLAGIPPTGGFFAKLLVLQAAWQAGTPWLVVFAVVMSVIGAFYYLRVVRLMYMDDPVDQNPVGGTAEMRVVLALNAVAILALGVMPTPLVNLCVGAIKASLGS